MKNGAQAERSSGRHTPSPAGGHHPAGLGAHGLLRDLWSAADGQGNPAHVIASRVRHERDRDCGVVQDSVDDRAETGSDGGAAYPPADVDQ
ncbi:hypothetical protein GCM10010425_79200 [Streptomyces spororaveus]|uniref:Uncharacterized protein n=1 Tax=Streptomyces spororaveus TaxID=284039 RepID=A0ABQ3TPF7_9ACTN|nr:hypothetical protein Sspor_78540 [Streptomyces spororaveus]